MPVDFGDGRSSRHIPAGDGTPLTEAVLRHRARQRGAGALPVLGAGGACSGAGEGSGLGLGMVCGCGKQSGGHMTVVSEAGKGAVFRLLLPSVHAGVATRTEGGEGNSQGGTETILVVEDEDDVREITVLLLESYGYRVFQAGDVEAALILLAEHKGGIDLVFTDVIMPGGMSGVDLANKVETDFQDIEILLTSGYPQQDINLETAAKLTGGFIPKPFEGPSLARAIRNALDKKP